MRRTVLSSKLKLRHQVARRRELRRELRRTGPQRGGQLSPLGKSDARVFNLDVHIGVIQDLRDALAEADVETTTWSLSLHNGLLEGKRPIPDPVRYINASKWRSLDSRRISRFVEHYRDYLLGFDGFVVTYPTAFTQVFQDLGKPILSVIATRYETPYTLSPEKWLALNESLLAGIDNLSTFVVANNRADADYFQYYTSREIDVVPSLCDKQGQRWTGDSSRRVIVGRSNELIERIERCSKSLYSSVAVLGKPYKWNEILRCSEVCVLPQNISTMLLFELATAGVPVAVPGKALMRSLVPRYPALLGELTFAQLEGRAAEALLPDDPCNWLSGTYLDWWLDRADFYNSDLMPNVRTFETIEELCEGPTAAEALGATFPEVIETRNGLIKQKRANLIEDFVTQLMDNSL